MGQSTLSMLSKQTGTSHEDLGTLVKQLVDAVTPLEGKFNGQGRARFDAFKARSDEITSELNTSLGAILGGQQGMNTSFQMGDQDMGDNAQRAQSTANFDGARFASRA
ncbi:hypothetical protein [Spelaeicoccus albus]|uniref:Uncharacterized protein YukE n=1 Tax=Spelaeicoccus albus TaxID=1280376 RepID=A0A7Z0D1T6_9MICO|nr:hypothetical protein [Spelaeicoccus albus]NYI66805.1 uncharacterized protein YukE [Spelaeicoccus albus]